MIKLGTIKNKLPYGTLAMGATLIGISQATGSAPQAAAGVGLIVLGGSARARRLVERAMCDTSRERDQLRRDQQAAQELQMKYVAARALLDKEAERLCVQAADLEREAAERMAAEREELMADLESREVDLKRQGWLAGYGAGRRGILAAPPQSAQGATVIPMPQRAIGSDATAAGKGSTS